MSKLNNETFTIVARRGTAANLALSTTHLEEGELAYATDTKQFYIGDASGNKNLVGRTIVTTVAGLSAVPGGQLIASVTDGDSGLAWGATIVNSGSGATKYLCWFNGTNWTVAGK